MRGYLVLESGRCFVGEWQGGESRAGEVVFNTSHNGYEEIATDPSYFGQIMVMCAPQQGNYGVDKDFWESRQLWIQGFICLELQKSSQNSGWIERLDEFSIPRIDSLDTRELVLTLREGGTQVGALVPAGSESEALEKAKPLIESFKEQDQDWAYEVSVSSLQCLKGAAPQGPKVAVIDFGCKQNIIRELTQRCREIQIYPSRASAEEILSWGPDGILLSNGPGDPKNVEKATDTIQQLIGHKSIFGICMGHQLLARALGGSTYKLKFGHRGANHPIKNIKTNEIYITSQNHGYAIESESLPSEVEVTHINLNDQTIAGIESLSKKCFSVQFHPESHPGPREAAGLFDQFINWTQA